MKIQYKNPVTDQVKTAHVPWISPLLCFLFGPFYFLFKGNYIHAILAFAVAWFTYGITVLIYPFFAKKINKDFYEHKGWIQV